MAFVKAAKVSDIPPGRIRVVELEEEDVALCNVDGEIYAVANMCTHDGGPLGDGYLLGDEIECPRHGARFNVRTGEVKTLPAIIPIRWLKRFKPLRSRKYKRCHNDWKADDGGRRTGKAEVGGQKSDVGGRTTGKCGVRCSSTNA